MPKESNWKDRNEDNETKERKNKTEEDRESERESKRGGEARTQAGKGTAAAAMKTLYGEY